MDSVLVSLGWNVLTRDLRADFYEASVLSSATASTSAAARAAHSGSGLASVACVVTGEQRSQTTLRFHPRPQPNARSDGHGERLGASARTPSMARRTPQRCRRRTRTLSSSSPRSRSRPLFDRNFERLSSSGLGSHLRAESPPLSKLSGEARQQGLGDGPPSRYPRLCH